MALLLLFFLIPAYTGLLQHQTYPAEQGDSRLLITSVISRNVHCFLKDSGNSSHQMAKLVDWSIL